MNQAIKELQREFAEELARCRDWACNCGNPTPEELYREALEDVKAFTIEILAADEYDYAKHPIHTEEDSDGSDD